MTRPGYRAVVVALGVVALALGATLFPPTGFGSAPADGVDLLGAGGDAASTGDTGTDDADTSTRSTDVGTPRAQGSDGGTPTPAGQTPDGAGQDDPISPAGTPTATPADTPTPTPEPEDDEADGLPLGLAFVGVVAVVLFVLVAKIFGLRGSGGSDGSGGRGTGIAPGALPLPGPLNGLAGLSPARIATRVPQVTMVALVGFSTGTTRVLGAAGSVGRDVLGGLAVAVGAGSRSASRGLFAGLSGLFSMPSPSLSVSGVLSGLSTGGSSPATGRSPGADARRATDVEPEAGGEAPIRTVEDAWAAFAVPLPVSDPDARTPGEFARLAVERGDPAGPVRRLTEVFRDVRYGGRPATDDRTRTAVDAATAIRDDREDDE